MKDPEFLADAKKLNLDVNPINAQTFHQLMARALRHTEADPGKSRAGDRKVING